MKKIPYGKQFIDKLDKKSVLSTLSSAFLTCGDEVPKFECAFSSFVGSKYAAAVSSGTAALHIAYMALGVNEKSTVITTPITFSATANAARLLGARVEFTDINMEDFLLSPSLLKDKLSSIKFNKDATNLIAPVHYAGLSCDMEAISLIAEENGFKVVEDACHALGATYKESKVLSCKYSNLSVCSFHPVKHITTGEGGIVTSNDEALYKLLLKLRSHGMEREDFVAKKDSPTYHEMQLLGLNYRMPDILASLGSSQLKKANDFIKRRVEIAQIYRAELPSFLTLQKEYDNRLNSQHLFPVLFRTHDERDNVFYALKEENIFTQIHYMPVNKQPYYANLGYDYLSTPNAYDFYLRELSLPIYYSLKDNDIERIIRVIKKALR